MSETQSMSAITYDSFGGVEQLRQQTVPMPVVGPSEVRIRVVTAAVNPVDWKILGGHLTGLLPHQFPIIPGWDVAGVVEAVGPDTPEFAVGDHVLAYARKDTVQFGTFAEYVSFSVRGVAAKPDALDWDAAAGLPLAGGTALRAVETARIGQGDVVLVHGAAGGVGSLAVQLARLNGARVIGTASEVNHDFLRGLGAEPITYGDGLVDRVRAIAPDGVDAVLDFVGGVAAESGAVLRDRSRHVSVVDQQVAADGGRVIWVRPDAEALTRLAGWAAAGDLTVPIAARYPLAEAAQAFTESSSGHTRGKIVITVADPE